MEYVHSLGEIEVFKQPPLLLELPRPEVLVEIDDHDVLGEIQVGWVVDELGVDHVHLVLGVQVLLMVEALGGAQLAAVQRVLVKDFGQVGVDVHVLQVFNQLSF